MACVGVDAAASVDSAMLSIVLALARDFHYDFASNLGNKYAGYDYLCYQKNNYISSPSTTIFRIANCF